MSLSKGIPLRAVSLSGDFYLAVKTSCEDLTLAGLLRGPEWSAISKMGLPEELGGDGIRANVIAPGFTLTDASYDHIEDAKNYGVDRAALRRNAEVDDISGGVLYLASDLSAFMTGQTLVIDGGKQFI